MLRVPLKMYYSVAVVVVVMASLPALCRAEYPEGYHPFEAAPGKIPPRVRKPPYLQSTVPCSGTLEGPEAAKQSLDNLCGDLNDGILPLNPLGHNIKGQSYPFGLIKNKTLDFFSKTLPILMEDKTLPKVAKMKSRSVPLRDHFSVIRRPIRSVQAETTPQEEEEEERKQEEEEEEEKEEEEEGRGLQGRKGRAFCDDNWGLFCLLYNAMSGEPENSPKIAQNRDDFLSSTSAAAQNSLSGANQPLTPCPSAVEYITPVFARNYQGVWRYVVQIPFEGYFTQTVEVTQCLSTQCHYLSGSCLASPRWVSLLVAEIYYPDALFPAHAPTPDLSRAAVPSHNKPPNQFPAFRERVGGASGGIGVGGHQKITPVPKYCDGQDEIGCFQVRLYYDWFLIPGSCKCWKQDYFASLAYKKK